MIARPEESVMGLRKAISMTMTRYARYAWLVLAYNILVVLWGAYVRATGSGAGCGSHWPLCNGVVVPRSPAVETLIEFSHRLSSGLALVAVVALVIGAFRAYPKGHAVRLGASLSMIFMITEALIGAGLVLFGLVAHNASLARAWAVATHLVNTFLLLAALTLTAHWASGGARLSLRRRGLAAIILAIGLLGMLVLGASGALTALGDTLFPASSLAEGIRQDFSPGAHFLIRLRLLHPAIAVTVSAYLVVAGWLLRDRGVRRWSRLLNGLVVVQLVAGVVNVLLLAPVWMQLLHLLLADLVWVTVILLAAEALAQREAVAPAPGPSAALVGA